jgi:hypothetical protein
MPHKIIKAIISASQEKMEATVSAIQSAQVEVEETISTLVGDIRVSVDWWLKSLQEELGNKIQRTIMLTEAMSWGLETELAELKSPCCDGCRTRATKVNRTKLARFSGSMPHGRAQQLD